MALTKENVLDPKKFLEFVKKEEERMLEKEEHFGKDDAYRETFLNEDNILDFLKIAEREARVADRKMKRINYLELYREYSDRQASLFKEDRLNPSKRKKKRKTILG